LLSRCEGLPSTMRDELLFSFSSWFLLWEPGFYHGKFSLQRAVVRQPARECRTLIN
jgi:hypothetical protein